MIRMAAALGMRALETRLEDLFNPPSSSVPGEFVQPSAQASLFPQASKPATIVAQPPTAVSSPDTLNVNDSLPIHQPSKGVGVVNPFAKKRKPTGDENDNGNKLARNA